MKLTYSVATEEDVPILVEILSDAVDYKLARGDRSWDNKPFTEDEVRHSLSQPGTTYLVRADGMSAATVTHEWEDKQRWGELHQAACYIHRLAVHRDFHGQGLGQQILEWSAEQARNKGLCAYYKNLGFELVDTGWNDKYQVEIALFERQIK